MLQRSMINPYYGLDWRFAELITQILFITGYTIKTVSNKQLHTSFYMKPFLIGISME